MASIHSLRNPNLLTPPSFPMAFSSEQEGGKIHSTRRNSNELGEKKKESQPIQAASRRDVEGKECGLAHVIYSFLSSCHSRLHCEFRSIHLVELGGGGGQSTFSKVERKKMLRRWQKIPL